MWSTYLTATDRQTLTQLWPTVHAQLTQAVPGDLAALLDEQPAVVQDHLLNAAWKEVLADPFPTRLPTWMTLVERVFEGAEADHRLTSRRQGCLGSALKLAIGAVCVPAIQATVQALESGPSIGRHAGDWFDVLYRLHKTHQIEALTTLWHGCSPAEREAVLVQAIHDSQGRYLATLVAQHPGEVPQATWQRLLPCYLPQDTASEFPEETPYLFAVLAPHAPLGTLAQAAVAFLGLAQEASGDAAHPWKNLARAAVTQVAARVLPAHPRERAWFTALCMDEAPLPDAEGADATLVELALVRWAQACPSTITHRHTHAWTQEAVERLRQGRLQQRWEALAHRSASVTPRPRRRS